MRDRWLNGCAFAVALGSCVPVMAWTDFCEMNDGGGDPMTAQRVEGSVGMVDNINGELEGAPPRPGGDFEDMYLIFIADPAIFEARIEIVDPPVEVRPQLWLFSGEPGIVGLGLLGNNGFDLPFNGALLGNESTDGSGVTITSPGQYYLAISGAAPGSDGPPRGRVPQSPDVLATGLPGPGLDIFQFGPVFEVSGPDGPGGLVPIDRWDGEGDVGTYRVALQGVEFLPPQGCIGDLDVSGDVGFGDVLLVLAAWGATNSPFDLDLNGVIDFGDLLLILQNWGPCP